MSFVVFLRLTGGRCETGFAVQEGTASDDPGKYLLPSGEGSRMPRVQADLYARLHARGSRRCSGSHPQTQTTVCVSSISHHFHVSILHRMEAEVLQ